MLLNNSVFITTANTTKSHEIWLIWILHWTSVKVFLLFYVSITKIIYRLDMKYKNIFVLIRDMTKT